MDTAMRKAFEILIEIAEERRIHEAERPEPEEAARIGDAIAQVRQFMSVMGDAAS